MVLIVMELGCGIDIIEISRIKDGIENLGENFINKIFTKNEIKYCENKEKQKYQHYAARFATKEAAFKALSKKLEKKYEISWKDIEVLNDKNGRPYLNIRNIEKYNIKNIDVSISHCKEYAVSNVIVVFNN